ncbi:Membrane lipoprotein TmpC [Terrisporobacter petrolearius]|uniref:BMP family ABC transporter substrate-binding protein n=1 Tax=Terrisporobacter hibernicus TaxID=2813371 RepID=A0AAX2ZB52_9FIRM|nr:BMP family ABC transporter substrate-binding protein [Terrisporobacter hibernicus]UEL46126.1 BMP family ABC transporter substrate-binding protein [Terrisporobacter hibernicus]SFJ62503.1 basic membrane protein A [Terrisporobacter glycolicus]
MKLKKLVALSLTMVMSVGLLVGCGSKKDEASEKVVKIGMITDVGGVHDESFNQSSWEGLQAVEKELGKDKIEVKVLESKQDSDYDSNIDQFMDQEMDLIIGVGYKLDKAIEKASKAYPEQKFAIIDYAYEKQPENVTSLLFEDNASSYLTGLIAGKMTKTNKVGFIGGMKGVVISKFENGFKAGVKDANPKAKISVQYANSFSDQALGKSIANSMIKNGVDVVFPAAGAVGTGAIESVKENGKMAIGVDRDQNSLAPDNVITSAMKNIDVAVGNLAKSFVDKSYKSGEVIIGSLATGGVGIAPTSDKNVPADVLEYVKAKTKEIVDGKIKVPATDKEYKELYEK